MNRTDRLLAIVLEIQARKQVRAEDLAALFEVTKRTIYRDMDALAESGVPLISVPGQGYSLVEGYFLPPLTFTADEAIMLTLGADFMAQNFDAQYRSAAQSAIHKIVTVLPDSLRREVEYLESSIRFVAINGPFAPEILQQLRRAIIQHKSVRFRYHARASNGKRNIASLREADPYMLIHVGGAWVLVAHCHLRRDIRHFRLDRMDEFTVLHESFARPANFAPLRTNDEGRTIIVRALFDPETARWVKESPSYYMVSQEEHPEGLLVTLTIQQPDDILQWLLRWGSHVRVLEPASMGELLANEAKSIIDLYKTSPQS